MATLAGNTCNETKKTEDIRLLVKSDTHQRNMSVQLKLRLVCGRVNIV